MSDISAKLVKELRDRTNVGFGDCKKALAETAGDIDAAVKLLREQGQVKAEKKADRAANNGLIAAALSGDNKTGAMVEVNCETDFVAKNSDFNDFVSKIGQQGLGSEDGALAEAAKEEVGAAVSSIGENIVISRNVRYTVDGGGAVTSYIHPGAQVGVLMELGCEKDDSPSNGAFQELAKDLCMHVAAMAPQGISREDIDEAVIAAEREIFAKQVEGKPAEIVDKIVDGKINKFYSTICMLEQGFVKDADQTVAQLIEAKGKEIGDSISLRRFERFQIGG